MGALALNKQEKKHLKTLSTGSFSQLSKTKQHEVLQLGAKDFSARFLEVIKKLATE